MSRIVYANIPKFKVVERKLRLILRDQVDAGKKRGWGQPRWGLRVSGVRGRVSAWREGVSMLGEGDSDRSKTDNLI